MDQQITPGALADRLRKLKEKRRWTWEEAARRVGITPGTVRQWRLGLIHSVRPSVQRRIEELEIAGELESQIVQIDPQWRETLRSSKLSVERILLSGNRAAIGHLINTLEVLQNYVEATEDSSPKDRNVQAKKGPKRDPEAH